LVGLWALEWAWHAAKTNMRCVKRNLNGIAFIFSEISAFIRTDKQTDRRTWLDQFASDPDQETLSSAFYILSNESSIPFYSTSNWYNNLTHFLEEVLMLPHTG